MPNDTPDTTVDTKPLARPLRVGRLDLQHRIALAPLTRFRANKDYVHGDLAVEYYAQRASAPGTLLISEGTFIAARAGGFGHVPGIWNSEQVASWRKITDAVHARGSYIYCQLWALGRAALPQYIPGDVVSSGDIPKDDKSPKPRPLSVHEIDEYVDSYVNAARNAIEAGFDGVEIHNANGYLLDQFLQTSSNNRTDEYGGSVENRARLTLRVANAVAEAVGRDRTGLRLSPYERYNGMNMPSTDIVETFSYVLRSLAPLGLAYIHLTEPRVSGQLQSREDSGHGVDESLHWATNLWFGRPGAEDEAKQLARVEQLPPVDGTPASTNVLILAGGYIPATAAARVAEAEAKGERVAIAFGRWFISNPDLPKRILNGLPLTPYYRPTFYLVEQAKGYTDYPFADETKASL